uniref:Uncharacterized protein n=1 Tax=Ananas comosus var. bracteatus TaxID=296719 RepID=A0A6V7Q2A0_ANACO|nr:unnamed protein product [Ananas comosus var. bracteatus]
MLHQPQGRPEHLVWCKSDWSNAVYAATGSRLLPFWLRKTPNRKALIRERGLRPQIFRVVHPFKIKKFVEVLDRALWVEHGNAVAREEHESFEKDKGKKRTTSISGDSRVPRGPEVPASTVQGSRTPTMRYLRVLACPFDCFCSVGSSTVGAPPPAASIGSALVPRQSEGPDRCLAVAYSPLKWRNLLQSMMSWQRLKGFDLILGMDWLSMHYVTSDCDSKVTTFREPGQEEFTYHGCRSSLFAMMVTTSRAKKLISSGCVAYLATVVETRRETPVLEDIPVVQEFSDVFPVELPEIPPDREIEFVIDLVP